MKGKTANISMLQNDHFSINYFFYGRGRGGWIQSVEGIDWERGEGIKIQSMELDYPHSFLRPVESKWGGRYSAPFPAPSLVLVPGGELLPLLRQQNRMYTRINSLRMRPS